jgi:signal transduction histidine kinase
MVRPSSDSIGLVQDSHSSTQVLLSKVSRYEALFELTGAINAAGTIEQVGEILSHRLKYVADVYCWRYLCFDRDPDDGEGPEPIAIVVDGFRGRATVVRTTPEDLSRLEGELWRERKTRILCGESLAEALEQLPEHFQKDDLEQISVNTLVEDGKTQALLLFCKRRQPFSELDVKCLSMVGGFFHGKVHMLWEQQRLRDLEQAYLQREVMLRQSEKLATLGRMSAGMAHELNNPAAAAAAGAGQLKAVIERLSKARFLLGAAGLTIGQQERVTELERSVDKRAGEASSLDPIRRGDLEEEVENWLEQAGAEEPWEHAPTLVAMGLGAAELRELNQEFEGSELIGLIDYVCSWFTVQDLLRDIGRGTRRIEGIVKALKGYSYMDQAPAQLVDVRVGLNNTLTMLNSKLEGRIDVNRIYAKEVPRIQGFGSELNQVWTHLIDNALTAMGEQGTLELKAFPESDRVVVEVADSGPGIALEVQDKIFDPFYTTKPPGEGTGLGLTLSHSIVVEKHGGEISVESRPGATRFTVKLPITGK